MTQPDIMPDQDEQHQVQLMELLQLLDQAPDGRLSRGVFSLWKIPADEGGGLLLSFRVDGADADQHLPLPRKLIDFAVSAATGKGPFGMLSRMMM